MDLCRFFIHNVTGSDSAIPTQTKLAEALMNIEVKSNTSVTATNAALKRAAKIVAGDADSDALRITVEGGGCSGFSYKFDLVAGKFFFGKIVKISFIIHPISTFFGFVIKFIVFY